jgi:hypothetical protein
MMLRYKCNIYYVADVSEILTYPNSQEHNLLLHDHSETWSTTTLTRSESLKYTPVNSGVS